MCEVLDLLLPELDFLEPGDDLVVGEEALLFPVLDELLQLFDSGREISTESMATLAFSSSLERILTCDMRCAVFLPQPADHQAAHPSEDLAELGRHRQRFLAARSGDPQLADDLAVRSSQLDPAEPAGLEAELPRNRAAALLRTPLPSSTLTAIPGLPASGAEERLGPALRRRPGQRTHQLASALVRPRMSSGWSSHRLDCGALPRRGAPVGRTRAPSARASAEGRHAAPVDADRHRPRRRPRPPTRPRANIAGRHGARAACNRSSPSPSSGRAPASPRLPEDRARAASARAALELLLVRRRLREQAANGVELLGPREVRRARDCDLELVAVPAAPGSQARPGSAWRNCESR